MIYGKLKNKFFHFMLNFYYFLLSIRLNEGFAELMDKVGSEYYDSSWEIVIF